MLAIHDGRTARQRYFDNALAKAPMIVCACGCGAQLKAIDNFARPRMFVSGHNTSTIYEDRGASKRAWNHRNRSARAVAKSAYHRMRKVKTVLLAGGKCLDCGIIYNGENAAIFHFHHRDPATKLFAVGNQVVNKAWARIVAEMAKCDLLCANCHEMRHGGGF